MEIFIKYLGIVQGTAEAFRVPTPIATQARQMFMMAASAGYVSGTGPKTETKDSKK